MDEATSARVREAWNAKSSPHKPGSKWWHHAEIVGHVSKKICGAALPGQSGGFHHRISSFGRFDRAVSIGCGNGNKECHLVRTDTVGHFDLFELADERMELTQKAFEQHGLAERGTFVVGDAFETRPQGAYDLVYWNSSLHHMLDTRAALEWSRDALQPGGLLAISEYTGPNRFQWTDRNLDYLQRFRRALPERLRLERVIRRRSIEKMIEMDPSEAADSEAILPAVQALFRNAEIISTGGTIYHMGLNDLFPILTPEDRWVLNAALTLDDALLELGENLGSVVFARK